MDSRNELPLSILVAAPVIGLVLEFLLRQTPWGANVPLGLLVLVGTAFLLGRLHGVEWKGDGTFMLAPAFLFAGLLAVRSSAPLVAANAIALLVSLTLASTRAREGLLRVAGIASLLLDALVVGFEVALGPVILVFSNVPWSALPADRWSRRFLSVARGLAIAVPPLIVFGVLFASADPLFERLSRDIFRVFSEEFLTHLALALVFGWIAAGLLRRTLLGRPLPIESITRPQSLSLGAVEVALGLGPVVALFAIFVAIQLRWLFGGERVVLATTGLTCSEYARRGFFELAAVVALTIPLLVGLDWLLRRDSPADQRVFRGLATAQIALVFVIIASAAQRMALYQREYGLTQQRFHVMAFIAWLAFVSLWLGATVLRGRRPSFAPGALVSGLAAIAILNAVNPDAWIVRANIERHASGRSLDAGYAANLGPDAVPALVEALPGLPAFERSVISRRLLDQWGGDERHRFESDWRSWNRSRSVARETVVFQRSQLLEWAAREAAPPAGQPAEPPR